MDKGDVGGLPKHTTTTTTKKRLLRHGDCEKSSASDAKTHPHHVLLLFPLSAERNPQLLLPPQASLASICDEQNGTEEQVELRRNSKQGPLFLFFVCFFLFFLWPWEENAVLKEGGGELKFQNGASCLYFTPLMLVPHLPPPHLYLNHTSNNDSEERVRVRGSTSAHPSVCRTKCQQMRYGSARSGAKSTLKSALCRRIVGGESVF